uniref:Uncharacterized protein n=1 Tax=Zea mays TaxID=4577 RepID=B4FG24_MAIZE|nr:unknown [Zea mays]
MTCKLMETQILVWLASFPSGSLNSQCIECFLEQKGRSQCIECQCDNSV